MWFIARAAGEQEEINFLQWFTLRVYLLKAKPDTDLTVIVIAFLN